MSASRVAATAAVNRFGLGARVGDLEHVADAQAWLAGQIGVDVSGRAFFANLPSSADFLRREFDYRRRLRAFKQAHAGTAQATTGATPPASRKPQLLLELRRDMRRDALSELAARWRLVVATDAPFMERLVHFWSNHFAVSLDKNVASLFAAPMEREAIRPHVAGRFSNLLLAVETHPAMLRYLDNVQSIGPESRAGEHTARRAARQGEQARGKAGGLNENLGREIMELHTLGVDGGYTQTDVTELARALTGWGTLAARDFAPPSHAPGADATTTAPGNAAFVFRAAAHEPGARKVLGKMYAAGGYEQGRAILQDLARQPATARHLATQLARHFVSDEPPPALITRLARSYLEHDTDLGAMYRTLIASPEAWAPTARKFKSPQDFMVSALRAGRIDVGATPQPILLLLTRLGEPLFTPRSPAGFPDVAANWMDANALWKRVQAAEALAERVTLADTRPTDLAEAVLGARLDAETQAAIRRAESMQQAVATLFACPAFQWRV